MGYAEGIEDGFGRLEGCGGDGEKGEEKKSERDVGEVGFVSEKHFGEWGWWWVGDGGWWVGGGFIWECVGVWECRCRSAGGIHGGTGTADRV